MRERGKEGGRERRGMHKLNRQRKKQWEEDKEQRGERDSKRGKQN